MNITFVLGNGYDKAFGLKTGYQDFYDWYLLQPTDSAEIKRFKNKIENGKKDTWSDFEVGLGRLSYDYGPYNIDDFLNCYDDALENLAEYIRNQEKDISISEENVKVFRNSLLNFYKELSAGDAAKIAKIIESNRNSDLLYNVVSLNYTNLIDEFFEKSKTQSLSSWRVANAIYYSKMGELVHAHGYGDVWPILGVDNEKQVNPLLLDIEVFSRIMIKKNAIDTIGESWTEASNSLLANSQIICTFGVSLGETDQRWWESIAKCLKKPNTALVIFHYDPNITSDTILIRKKIINERLIKGIFLKYVSEEEAEEIRDKIFVIINTKNVFNFGK